ncbi:MAG: hypothetical protein AB8B77_02040 [Alphaproteobacteria bacterium]
MAARKYYGSPQNTAKIARKDKIMPLNDTLLAVLNVALVILIGLCCLLGFWAHWQSRKHILKDQGWAMRKDSLMQRRHLALNETGMRFVALQKKLMAVMLILFLLLLFLNRLSTPNI